MVSPSKVFAGRPDVGHDRMHPMRRPGGVTGMGSGDSGWLPSIG